MFIEGLEVDTVIGAYDWERGIRQCLRLDLSFAWDNRPAAAGDDLTWRSTTRVFRRESRRLPSKRSSNWSKPSPSVWLKR